MLTVRGRYIGQRVHTMFYWFKNLKMNADYKTALICVQPILDSMVPYLHDLYGYFTCGYIFSK